MRPTMTILNLCVAATLALWVQGAAGQDRPDGRSSRGQGGRPSAAQIAAWRAQREALEQTAAGHHGASDTPGTAAVGGRGERPTEAAVGRGEGAPLWLSETPPPRDAGAHSSGARWGGTAVAHAGPPVKRLWLRSGADPLAAGSARGDATAAVLLVTPQGNPDGEPLPPAEQGQGSFSFEMPLQGFYRLYVTSRRLQGERLQITVAKAEVVNFSHGGDGEERVTALAAPRVLASAPIEIVRERTPREELSFLLKSGDEQAFLVLQGGLPRPGARVRFISQQGWSKEAVSDAQGRVRFQIVRDYLPPWSDFQKRYRGTYLLTAETHASEAGSYRGQPYAQVDYQATLAGSYYPSPTDYRSSAWGLGVILPVMLFSGTAVYVYRRRRVRPFQEVRFHDAP
jgi:hypothetical protein